jgi:N-glycosylase/DNA lyase
MIDTINTLEKAVIEVARKIEQKEYVKKWHDRDEYSLWYELVACLLGSNVMFEHAQAAAKHLHSCNLLDFRYYQGCHKDNENEIAKELSKPLFPPLTTKGTFRKYRFPNIRAKHICSTAKNIYGSNNTLKALLYSSQDAHSARKNIVAQSVGIGPKQASLFLRNINYDDDLAILDSHVLKYMRMIGLLCEQIGSIVKIEFYERIEKTLQRYATQLGKRLCHLDTAIWIVMRVYQRDY